jgi:uncharacterized protein (TIGR02118 family)
MKAKTYLLFVAIVFLSAFQTAGLKSSKIQKGMIKVSVLYPAGEGKTFNWEYYTSKHVPMVKSLLGNSVKSITIDKGISGRTPDSPATYVAMFHMYFETVAAYQNAFGPNADKIRSDIPNYTNIQPVVQISEVQE